MALEKPDILQVKDNVVRVDIPYHIFDDTTYLAAPSSATATSSTVLDNTNVSDNDWLVFGNIGDDKCEIVQVTASPTRGTAIAHDALVFDHSIDEPVRILRYNQVAVHKSSTATDSSPTIIGSAVTIDVSQGFNIFDIAVADQDAYYYARFTNSETSVNSEFSTSVAATGVTRNSLNKMMETAAKRTQTKISDTGVITKDYLIETFNEWQEWMFEGKRDWTFLRSKTPQTIALRLHTQEYTLATDIQDTNLGQSIAAITLTHRSTQLEYKDPEIFFEKIMKGVPKSYLNGQITAVSTSSTLDNSGDFESSGKIYVGGDELDYTTNTKSTNVISGMDNPSTTHADDSEVYGAVSEGLPQYYTVTNDKLYIWPLVSSENEYETMRVWYYIDFTDLDEINDTTVVPVKRSAIYYLMSKIEEAKGDPNQKADKFLIIATQAKNASLQKELSERRNVFTTYDKSNIYA